MHAYNIETGEPCHEIPTKKGAKNATRATRVSDLNKHDLYASVTTIIEDIASPDLEFWKNQQVLKAAYETPAIFDESLEEWSRAVMEKATRTVRDAADHGDLIHDALRRAICGLPWDDRLAPHVKPPLEYFLSLKVQNIKAEKVIVNRAIGTAGTVDVRGEIPEGDFLFPLVVDWKTKKTEKGEKIKIPETYPWQCAAYHVSAFGAGQRELHPNPRSCNIFISSTEPGRFEPVWYTREQLEEGWEAFKLCHRLYCIRNKWKPKIAQ